jgi:hypothetical protein
MSGRSFNIGGGIPNGPKLHIGEVYDERANHYSRGPKIGVAMGVPFLIPRVVTLTFGGSLYYPPLGYITRYGRKPAQKIVEFKDKVVAKIGERKSVQYLGRKVTSARTHAETLGASAAALLKRGAVVPLLPPLSQRRDAYSN